MSNVRGSSITSPGHRKAKAAPKPLRIADLFCGAGGSSNGIVEACDEFGLQYRLSAVNHWDIAVATHSANHPNAKHLRSEVDQLKERELSEDGRLDVLWASPSCSEHSYAKGGKSIDDQNRVSAWAIVREIERYRPRLIFVENVRNFLKWGPLEPVLNRGGSPKLDKNGEETFRPIQKLKGQIFRAWVNAIEAQGYSATWDLLNSADYGESQSRLRLFVCFVATGLKFTFPTPSHGKPGTLEVEQGLRKPWNPARRIIDFTVSSESIFDRVKPLSKNTMRRITAGLKRYCSKEATEAFLVVLRRFADAQSLDQPTPTIVAGGGHLALAEPLLIPYLVNMKGQSNYRGIELPAPTLTAHAPHLYLVEPSAFILGQQSNAVARAIGEPLPTIATGGKLRLAQTSIQPFLCANRTNNVPRELAQPLPTITTTTAGGIFVVEPSAQQFVLGQHGGSVARSLDDPFPTITKDAYVRIFEPVIIDVRHGRRPHRPRSIHDPLRTVTRRNGIGMFQPFISSYAERDGFGSGKLVSVPHSVDSPLSTVLTRDRFGLIEPFVTAYYGGESGSTRTRELDFPLPTIPTANRFGFVEPFIEPFITARYTAKNGNERTRSAALPMPTILAKNHFGIVEPFIVPQQGYGTQPLAYPLPTITSETRGMRFIEPAIEPYLVATFGERSFQLPRTHSLHDPMPTVTHRGAGDLIIPVAEPAMGDIDPRRIVDIDGVPYVFDIRFRMLQPHELAAAQGFPEDYIFTGSKTAQTAQIGNAVPRRVARALMRQAIVTLFGSLPNVKTEAA